ETQRQGAGRPWGRRMFAFAGPSQVRQRLVKPFQLREGEPESAARRQPVGGLKQFGNDRRGLGGAAGCGAGPGQRQPWDRQELVASLAAAAGTGSASRGWGARRSAAR